MRFVPWLLLFFLVFVPACQKKTKPALKNELNIIYTTNVLSEIEPCGCKIRPLGGLAIRKAIINEIQSYGNPVFVLESGDTFFKSTVAPEYLKDAWAENANFIVKNYNQFPTHAMAIGENDFALGVAFLKELEKKADFPFLNANLIFKKSKKRVFQPYTIKKVHDLKVGIFSVVRKDLTFPQELEAKDPIQSAKEVVSELKPKVDFIIALTHLGRELDIQLASKVSGIDFIIGGHDGTILQKPTKVGNTLIFQVGDAGKYMGLLTVSLQKGVHTFYTQQSIELSTLKASEIDEKLKDVRRMKKGSLYQTDPKFKENVDAQEEALLSEKFNLLKDVAAIQKSGSFYYAQLLPVDPEKYGKGDKKIYARVQAFKEKLQTLHERKEKEVTVEEKIKTNESHTLEYATYSSCVQCHKQQYDVWKKSKHASAMIPLYIRNQHKNPECVTCHSVGLQKPGGFTQISNPFEKQDGSTGSLDSFLENLLNVSKDQIPANVRKEMKRNKVLKKAIQQKDIKGVMLELRDHPAFDAWIRGRYILEMEKAFWKKDFVGVQCENCHGPRGLKDATGTLVPHFSKSDLFIKKVEAKTCLQCHTKDHDDTFDFHKDRNVKGEKQSHPPYLCQKGVF